MGRPPSIAARYALHEREILDAWRAGATVSELCCYMHGYGGTFRQMKAFLISRGIAEPVRAPSPNPAAQARRALVRQRRASGLTYAAIGRELGVSATRAQQLDRP